LVFLFVKATRQSRAVTNPQESRKEWLLYLFKYFAKASKQYSENHFWQYTVHPILLYSNEVIAQK
jgi:hypothetical protein